MKYIIIQGTPLINNISKLERLDGDWCFTSFNQKKIKLKRYQHKLNNQVY